MSIHETRAPTVPLTSHDIKRRSHLKVVLDTPYKKNIPDSTYIPVFHQYPSPFLPYQPNYQSQYPYTLPQYPLNYPYSPHYL